MSKQLMDYALALQKEKGVFINHIYFCYENKRIFVQKCYEILHSMLYRSY